MDRTWTKRARKQTKKQKKPPGKKKENYAARRVVAGAAVLLSLAGLILLTNGAAARRLLQLALPVTLSASRPARTAGPALTILRVDVEEGVGGDMRIEVLSPKTPLAVNLGGSEPRVLIYHTHATEAYTQNDTYRYKESGGWRTKDNTKNIVAVGALLAEELRAQGCNVLHDTTDHEPPKLSTAYSRSRETIEKYKAQYPKLTMFIDVHRDAGKDPAYVMIDGKRIARMMFVVGTGEGLTGTGFGQMPDFESNYALALSITNRLADVNERLMRNIRVKTGRYNQHVSSQCLLVEMGDNANSLEDALNAVPYLARAIVESASGITAPSSAPAATQAPLWAPRQ
ncbi:MAG: stage II sporulation protein P [Clostridiales bacterium]|jgi:stage II sporulation protein P|nr:stage II sporulation protein P [Clostridiales bacterium]